MLMRVLHPLGMSALLSLAPPHTLTPLLAQLNNASNPTHWPYKPWPLFHKPLVYASLTAQYAAGPG